MNLDNIIKILDEFSQNIEDFKRAINEKNANVLALSSSRNSIINEPFRGNGFNDRSTNEFKNK